MPKYIDADAFYDELERNKEMMLKQGGWSAPVIASSIDIVQRRIKGYPTADVAPIVRGHWCRCYKKELGIYCSVCAETVKVDGSPNLSCLKYCPNCGAKMDEINGRMIEMEERENTVSNEAKKIIETVKRGELPELPDVDKQVTFGLQTIGEVKK